MAEYMGMRIAMGAQDYVYVISKRPDLKDGIDVYLEAHGWTPEGGE